MTKKQSNSSGTASKLEFLVSHYYVPGELTREIYTKVAIHLSKQVKQDPPWLWNYVHQVHRGKLVPSKRFLTALELHYRKIVYPSNTTTTIRINFPPEVDGKAEKKRILNGLTPLERYHALAEKVDKKEPLK